MNKNPKAWKIVLWVLRVLLGLAFLAASFMKLSGQPAMVEEFEHVGLGQWFRYLTGILELIGGIAVLIPSYSVYGALLLLVIDCGAFVALVTVLHMDWIHAVVIGVLLGVLVFMQRDTFSGKTMSPAR